MRNAVLGKHSANYIIQVTVWATRLGADEMTIWRDGTVTLECADGCICNHYKPTPQELKEV